MADEDLGASPDPSEKPISPETRAWLEKWAKSRGWTYLQAELWYRDAQRRVRTPAEIALGDQLLAWLTSPEQVRDAERQMKLCPTSSVRNAKKIQKPDQN